MSTEREPTRHMLLHVELPVDMDAMKAVREIATCPDDTSGMARIDGHDLYWRVHEEGEGVEIDRRQRLAAAMLLMGFDLPQEMLKSALSMMEAARICPDLNTHDVGGIGRGRRAMLETARELIDEMLAEKGDAN